MKKVLFMSFIVCLFCLSACEKKDVNLEHKAVEAKFQLLNEANQPATVFNEGEDIIFDYYLINKTDTELTWYFNHPDNHPGFGYHDMFKIFQIQSSSDIEIGTPHNIPSS